MTAQFSNKRTEGLDALATLASEEYEELAPPGMDVNASAMGMKLDFEPRLNPVQRESYLSKAMYVLAYGERASGKCTTPMAFAYLNERLARMRSLNPGVLHGFADFGTTIWGFDGLLPIKGFTDYFYAETSQDAINCDLEHGGRFIGSPAHRIWCCVWKPDREAEFKYVNLGTMDLMMKDGYRIWTPLLAHPDFVSNRYPSNHYTYVDQITVTNNIAYALGALCGDGSLNRVDVGSERSIIFTNTDAECIDRVRRGVGECGCVMTQSKSNPQSWIVSKSKQIRRLLSVGKLCCLSYYKQVPDYIVSSNRSVLCSFLRGLFDTDGTVEKTGTISYCTTSEQLGIDVQELLIALGIMCSRRPRKSASGRPTWNLSIMGRHTETFARLIGFEIQRKQKRIRIRSKHHHNCYGYPEPIKRVLRHIVEITCGHSKVRKHNPHDRAWHAKHRSLRQIFKFIPSTEKLLRFMHLFGGMDLLKDYMVSDTWVEIVRSSPTKSQLVDLSVPTLHNYLASGIISHNTIGALHKLIHHCVHNYNALAMVITGVRRQAEEGGAWWKLQQIVLPEWQAGMGVKYSDSKVTQSKDAFIWVSNIFGGYSRVILLSMPIEGLVPERFRGPEPSFILVDEANTLDSDVYFKVVVQQIGRRPMIKLQQVIYCCNPAGPSHWLYNRFFVLAMDVDSGERMEKYAVFHVPIAENIANLPPGYYENLIQATQNDPTEYRRMVLGEWIDSPTGEALFKDYYDDHLHLRGDAGRKEGILPARGYDIVVGYDLGAAHSSVTFQQVIPTKLGQTWIVFDEVNTVDQYISYPKLVPMILKRMDVWQERLDKGARFIHVSDTSAFNQFRAAQGSFDALEVERLSEGRIKLRPAPKGPGSVETRVRMTREKLADIHLLVSATCNKTRDMLLNIEEDPRKPMHPKRSIFVHSFDSLTYPHHLYMAVPFKPQRALKPEVYAAT